ncbi:MAG: PAS domain S-box protein [Pseudomonadota bacterium]
MKDDERLREALLELETLRDREAQRLRETRALLAAVEALNTSTDVDEGLEALLASSRASLNCDGVVLFEASGDDLTLRLPASSEPAVWTAPGLLTRSRRIINLQGIQGLWQPPPPALAAWRSLLTVPLIDGETRMVLAAHDVQPGKFTSADAELIGRLATIAGQAILRRSLERRNAFLATVIDRSPTSVTIAEVSDEMPLIYLNDAFVDLSGYTREEMLDRNCRFLTAEAPDAPGRIAIRKAVARRGSGTFVLRNRRKDGTEFWNQLQLFPIENQDGTATHMVATQTDVTDRVRAEEERDEARRRLESALAATSEAFLILGREGHVRFSNDPFQALLDIAWLERNVPVPHTIAARLLDRPLETMPERVIEAFNEPVSHEFTARDGRQFLLRAQPIPDGGAVITASDITRLKVNERALRQRLAAIERSEDGIAIGDAEGRIVDANPSLAALWGIEEGTVALGRKWTSFYEPASIDVTLRDQSQYRSTGALRGEAEIETAAGRRTHEVSLSLVPDVGSILVVRDVTDRLHDQVERDEMRRRLDRGQMQERLHQVSAGLAHDFNNLLSAILGSAALLETTPELSEAGRAALVRIQTAAGRAAELIDGLLDLGSREKSAETIDLKKVLASTVDLARGGAPSSAQLSFVAPKEPLFLQASQTDVLQVAMNLVVNAIDALGGMPGEVRVTLTHPATRDSHQEPTAGKLQAGRTYAAIAIEDTGTGMSAETVARVFEPYFTTKGNTGTGLGLAIVASIVADTGGCIDVDSAVGRGTKITVWWPTDLPVAADGSTERPRSDRTDLPLLILDDAPEVAAALAVVLSEAGFEVAETDDPEFAIETISEDPAGWGCLITDYDMPKLTGGDVVERLSIVAPDLPVIVVSALARRLTDPRLARASNVLQKPVPNDTLISAVREATGGAA